MNCSEKLKKQLLNQTACINFERPAPHHQLEESIPPPWGKSSTGFTPSTADLKVSLFTPPICSPHIYTRLSAALTPLCSDPLDLLSPVCTKVPWEGCVCSARDRSPGSLQDLTTQKCCVDIEYLCLVINVHVCFRFLRILCLFILLCMD